MLAYLVLTDRNGAPIDEALIQRVERDPFGLPFEHDEQIVWASPDRSRVFLGWQAFTELAGIGSHWIIDDAHRLTAFSGHCWPRTNGWKRETGQSWATQLRAWLGDDPDPPSVREELFGTFTLISLPDTGPGWVMPDWANVDQLYVAETPEITAVSNRAALCAQAVTPEGVKPLRSLAGAGWIVCEGWMLDQETGYWDVERPRAGSFVDIAPGRGARVFTPRVSPLLPPEPEDPPPTYEELLDANDRELRQTMRIIANLPIDDRVLSLSGGKDSRTIAGVIISEGLQDRFRFVTNGAPERADVIAAKAIATRFGLTWEIEDSTERSPELELDNAHMHTSLVEGMTSAWGTFVRPDFSKTATVSGVGGEGMRWMVVSGSAVQARTVDDVLAALRRTRPIDPLRVLRPDARAYYQSWVDGWVRDLAENGVPLKSIPALYMHEALVHSRNGPDYTWSPRLRINPFVTPTCLRANHRLPVDQRPNNRFHLDLQRRSSVELSKLPLADATWPETAYAQLTDAAGYREIEPVHSRNTDGRTWRQKRYADYRPLLEPILLDRENPLGELLDYDRLVERVATGDANSGRTRMIWGVLTAALWMGRHERLARIGRT